MKTRYFKKIFASALMVTAILGTSSCINDLDISPIDPQYAPSFDQNDVFVKEYALLGLTGQKGPAGSADLDGQDEGESGFYRTIFNCNELPSDECIWAWQTDTDIPQLTNISWNSSAPNGHTSAWDTILHNSTSSLTRQKEKTMKKQCVNAPKSASCVHYIISTSLIYLVKHLLKNTLTTSFRLKRKAAIYMTTSKMS